VLAGLEPKGSGAESENVQARLWLSTEVVGAGGLRQTTGYPPDGATVRSLHLLSFAELLA
jgi:hypothetical protein